MFVDCGIPHMIHSNNAPEFKLEKWTKLMKTYLIKNTYTEAYNPNQNPCDHHGGVLKVATSHLLLVTGAPLNFWCYALEIALLQSVIAHWNLNWDTPHTLHYGDTLDIGIFHFVFWSPVWYYAPSNSFPHSKASLLDLPIMLGMHFAFSLLSMTMILTPVKYLHDQSSNVDIHGNHLRQWIPANTTI